MLGFLPQKASRILEVGCGSGSFGVILKDRFKDAELVGIENNLKAAKLARGVFDQVWEGDVNEVVRQNSDQKFDLVVFNDILEHLIDPWTCLLLTKKLLTDKGIVMASIPNIRFWPVLSDLLFQGDWRYRDAGVMDNSHLRFFTKKSIQRLFLESGFHIVTIEGINKTRKPSIRWKVLNILFAGDLHDCLFPQFAVVAKPL